jgi:apolipoprotein N-acyltransferase
MQSKNIGAWKLWAAAGLSAGLLELPFPLAGPLPVWRTVFAWFGLVPLLWALLSPQCIDRPRPLRRGFLLGYLCGVLWFAGNCYWVRDTMLRYGDMPLGAPTLLLIGYSLVLGTYFGLFGMSVVLMRRATGSTRLALAFAPFFWASLELVASRITSVPWDQLGYSQVDNALVNQLAPWTGVYGISFVLVGVNALLTGGLMLKSRPHIGHRDRMILRVTGVLLMMTGAAGVSIPPPPPSSSSPISTWPPKTRGRAPASGSSTSPSSSGWPANSVKLTLPESLKPTRPPAKSSARLTPRIPIWWSGRSRPRPSSRAMPVFSRR